MSNHSQHDDGGAGRGGDFLRLRVRPFESDQLHSAAYLADYVKYLDRQHRGATRQQPVSDTRDGPQVHRNTFLYAYPFAARTPNHPVRYDDVKHFLSDHILAESQKDDQDELIFLAGCPSPAWLVAVAQRYSVDHRFLQRHLDFLPSGQRDSYTTRDLPSRAQGSFRLCVPSIIFIGQEGRHVKLGDIQEARQVSLEQLRLKHKAFSSNLATVPGRSIVRHVDIHSGDAIVIEQAITVSLIRRESTVKVLVLTDAGHDATTENMPVPNTANFRHPSLRMEFCPVYFETYLTEATHLSTLNSNIESHRQPLAILSSRYGETMDWNAMQSDPVLVLEELFKFQSAASMQYLRMLRRHVIQLMAQSRLTDLGVPNMEDILHFDYTKSALLRWKAHFCDIIDILKLDLLNEPLSGKSEHVIRRKMIDHLVRDFNYLQRDAKTLIDLCDNGKMTILSNHALSESRRTANENRVLMVLTKAMSRITFIFLPISFVTAVFGMNFKQFGQGTLSIWLWVAVTIPLLTVCVVLVEWGTQIASSSATYFQNFASSIGYQ